MATCKIRSVVFDLDGTLFDSLPCVLKALRHAVMPFEARTIDMGIFPLLGGPPERFMPEIVSNPENAPEALRRMEHYFEVHGSEIEPFDGTSSMLQRLSLSGAKLAIWTGRERISSEKLLREHKLESFFDVVVCGDDFSTHKPHPLGLEHICEKLCVQKEDVLFVGDSDVDAMAGKAGGVRTLIVANGREVPAEIQSFLWHIASNTAEAYRIALAWGTGEVNPLS